MLKGKSRSDKRKVRPQSAFMEPLEPRVLLTTIYGGETFEFTDAIGQRIEVAVGGDAIIELIGAVPQDGSVTLGDMAGTIVSSPFGRSGFDFLGGAEGDGIELIGPSPGGSLIIDSIDPDASISLDSAGVEDVEIAALATRESDGATFGFNIMTVVDADTDEESTVVQLLSINTDTGVATVVAHLQGLLPVDDDGVSTVSAIQAADFNPIDGLLYFVASSGEDDLDRLYTIDVDSPTSVDRISGTFGENDENPLTVRSIAFDQTSPSAAILRAFIHVTGGDEDGQGGFLATVNTANTNNTSLGARVTFRDINVKNIGGIEFVNPDANAAETFIYATTYLGDGVGGEDGGTGGGGGEDDEGSDSDPKLLKINIGTGVGENQGQLIDSEDNSEGSEPHRGSDIQGLTWDPVIRNPFTGEIGALIGSDATSDEIVFIDHRYRAPNADLFTMYVAQASDDVQIRVSVVIAGENGERTLLPYSGTSLGIEIPTSFSQFNLLVDKAIGAGGTEDNTVEINFGDGVGGAYLGGRSLSDITGDEGETLEARPIVAEIAGFLGMALGVRPNIDDFSQDPNNDVAAGLVVARNLLEFFNVDAAFSDRLMGGNFDNVQGLAASRAGVIYAVDTDGRDANGEPIDGDELGIIDENGQVGSIVEVTDGTNPLSGIQGLDFGDLDLNGSEELFAIYDIGGTPTLGTINGNPLSANHGVFTAIGALSGITGVRAMAFSPNRGSISGQQGLYVVTDDNQLVEIDPTSGAAFTPPIGPLLESGSLEVEIGSMDFDASGQLFGHDIGNGRLVAINRTTGAVTPRSSSGTLRPTVGAISFDFSRQQFLAADNSTGSTPLIDEESDPTESAVLMVLSGTGADAETGQNIKDFLFGGIVTGLVDMSGSVETFYAGAVVTGQTGGQLIQDDPEIQIGGVSGAGNFRVAGNLQNLFVASSIGTDSDAPFFVEEDPDSVFNPTELPGTPDYYSGTDIVVGGKVGQIRALGSIYALIDVTNSPGAGVSAETLRQREIEFNPFLDETESDLFAQFQLFNTDGTFSNDTFASAQRLGSLRNAVLGGDDFISVEGQIEFNELPEEVDFYSVALMAGQTITVQLTQPGGAPSIIGLGVFDPDGRLIETNYSNNGDVPDQLVITADRPGEYRVAVGNPLVGLDVTTSPSFTASGSYLLNIDGIGDLAVGGIVAGRDIYNNAVEAEIQVHQGDLGSISAAGTIAYGDLEFGSDVKFSGNIVVEEGDIRSIEASDIGLDISGYKFIGFTMGPSIQALRGSIGLLRGTSAFGGVLALPALFAGGDIQVIDGNADVFMDLTANGSLGVVRAGAMNGFQNPSFITVNADNVGPRGVIDLIDVTGDFGELSSGGPRITTGAGGNVRYIRVDGDVYQDPLFGGGAPTRTQLAPGEAKTLRDDSGGEITIRPTGESLITVDVGGEDLLETEPNSLNLVTYGIRGSGGVVIVEVFTEGSLEIVGSGNDNGAPVEIGEIRVAANGRGVGTDLPDDATAEEEARARPELLPIEQELGENFQQDLELIIRGDTRVDLFSLFGASRFDTPFPHEHDLGEGESVIGGSFSRISNSTGGEIVGIYAGDVGRLVSAGDIGIASRNTAAAVEGNINNIIPDQGFAELPFPYSRPRQGIHLSRTIEIRSDRSIGNVMIRQAHTPGFGAEAFYNQILLGAFQRSIERIIANADGVDEEGVFEGIAGPIYVSENLRSIDIGEGVLDTGSGDAGRSGVYAQGRIGAVRGSGIEHDIRGDILGEDGIGSITLRGGALINADILSTPIEEAREFDGGLVLDEIGDITLIGRGGIIGSNVTATDIGDTTVEGGFGIVNTSYFVSGDGIIGNVIADGFGIRQSSFLGGQSIGNIRATGNGSTISVTDYTPSVRVSEVDPDLALTTTDLATALGAEEGLSGVIDLVEARGSRDVGAISAYAISNSVFNYANSTKGVRTHGLNPEGKLSLDNVQITTGSIGFFKPDASISATDLQVAGRIREVHIFGDVLNNSRIAASGPNGNIGTIIVEGDMDGDIEASGHVGRIDIKGDLSGNIIIEVTNRNRLALKSLKLGGSLTNGSLEIDGDVQTISVAGGLGEAGDRLVINGNLGTLRVGTSDDATLNGADLALDLFVLGNLDTVVVDGKVSGDVNVKGSTDQFLVRADAITRGTDIVSGDVTITRSLSEGSIVGGDLSGDFTVGLNLSDLIIDGGNIEASSLVTSSFGDIGRVVVRDGDLLGSIVANNGDVDQITISGSDIGADSRIETINLGLLRLDGMIRGGAQVLIQKVLSSLIVGQGVEDGAAINAGGAESISIADNFLGDLTIGRELAGTRIEVGGNLGGDADIDANTRLSVGGDLVAGATLSVGKNLEQLSFGDTIFGDVLVDGAGGGWSAGAISGAVITTGFDLATLDVRNAIAGSLIQIGLSRGDDGVFSADAAGKDLGEEGRMANLGRITANSIANSVIAAGGGIGEARTVGGVFGSSLSSGFVVGSEAAAGVLADGSPLADGAERAAARSGDDRALFRGNFTTAAIGAGLSNSELSAGVDPGADGEFGTGDDSVIPAGAGGEFFGGGRSFFGTVNATADANSAVVADGGIGANNTTGGVVTPNVTYSINDLTGGNPLETARGQATAGAPLSYVTGGKTVTVTVTGAGTVFLSDANTGDSVLDTVVISGGSSATDVVITTSQPGGVSIGRLLAADDSQLRTFSFDGDIVGDGTDAVDIWLESDAASITFADLGDAVSGVIGGDVGTLSIQNQGAGLLRVLGHVSNLRIAGGNGDPLLTGLGAYAGRSLGTIAVNSAGTAFVVEDGRLKVIDISVSNGDVSQVDITDSFTGEQLIGETGVRAVDFSASDELFAVARVLNLAPTRQLGALSSNDDLRLSGLAISASGRAFAVEHFDEDGDGDVDLDRLVEINRETGASTPVAELSDLAGNGFANNVLQLAFRGNTLYALVNDADGTGDSFGVDALDPDSNIGFGVALVRIEAGLNGGNTPRGLVSSPANSALPPVRLDGGGATNDFTAMAVRADGTIYAVRRDLGDTQDELVTIDIDGNVSQVGLGFILFDSNGDGAGDSLTRIVGMGFDEGGNLVALNRAGGATQLIGLDSDSLTDTTAFRRITRGGGRPPGGGAWAGRVPDRSETFAFDFDGPDGGAFYTNDGGVQTLGVIDASTGEFLAVRALSQDADGSPLSSDVVAVAIDRTGSGDVFVATEDGRLLRYNEGDGSLIEAVGSFTDATTGNASRITAMRFDASGELVGIDTTLNRLVTIDTGDATVRGRTRAGGVFTDLDSLAFDADGVAFAFNETTDRFVAFRGTTEASLGGIVTNSVAALSISGAYASRVATTGNSIGSATINGNFSGSLSTPGTIDTLSINGRNDGAASADLGIDTARFRGIVGAEGVLQTRGHLGSLDHDGGFFGGLVEAGSAGNMVIRDDVADTGNVLVARNVDNFTVVGDVAGNLSLGSVRNRFEVVGRILTGGDVAIEGDAKVIAIDNGMAVGSTLNVGGFVRTLTVGGAHNGFIAVADGARNLRFNNAARAVTVIGLDTSKLRVTGRTTDSLWAFGTLVGADGLYNTADDVISGGSLDSAVFESEFEDSALVAGILPDVALGGFTPGVTDNLVFTGDAGVLLSVTNAAEAGGLLTSRIRRVTIEGSVISTPAEEKHSVVAAADDLGRITVGAFPNALIRKVFTDPFGAPQVERVVNVSASEIRVFFNEDINTGSLVLARDNDNDGTVTGAPDVAGSVLVVDESGQVLDDTITLLYGQSVDNASGRVTGHFLRIISTTDFTSDISVTLFGSPEERAIYDRSGLRSALRDPNQDGVRGLGEDPFGTLLDGNADGHEGDDFTLLTNITDVQGDFIDALDVDLAAEVIADGGSLGINESIRDEDDIDVFHFSGAAGQFLGVDFVSEAFASMGIFLLDNQGTLSDRNDDRFELLAKYDTNVGAADGDIFAGFELPETGTYFIVVGPVLTDFGPFFDPAANNNYSLNVNVVSDVADLVLPPDGRIAFTNNVDNPPKQLVYVNFEGGNTTEMDDSLGQNVVVSPLEAETLSNSLAGQEANLINGNTALGVTGIVDNMIAIFNSIPAGTTEGVVTAERIGSDLAAYNAASSGLFFTTEDPTGQGVPFTTIFIGDVVFDEPLFGIASQVDIANMDKSDEAIVGTELFRNLSSKTTLAGQLNDYSRALANVAAHELGHTIGLSHTDRFTLTDDPDNDPNTVDDLLPFRLSLMASGRASINQIEEFTRELWALGTADVWSGSVDPEFAIGSNDIAALLARWLS